MPYSRAVVGGLTKRWGALALFGKPEPEQQPRPRPTAHGGTADRGAGPNGRERESRGVLVGEGSFPCAAFGLCCVVLVLTSACFLYLPRHLEVGTLVKYLATCLVW